MPIPNTYLRLKPFSIIITAHSILVITPAKILFVAVHRPRFHNWKSTTLWCMLPFVMKYRQWRTMRYAIATTAEIFFRSKSMPVTRVGQTALTSWTRMTVKITGINQQRSSTITCTSTSVVGSPPHLLRPKDLMSVTDLINTKTIDNAFAPCATACGG